VSRLGPHDIAAVLVRALNQNNQITPATTGTRGPILPRHGQDIATPDISTRQQDIWAQQQQQRAQATSNVWG